jgi:hypothetical protein
LAVTSNDHLNAHLHTSRSWFWLVLSFEVATSK